MTLDDLKNQAQAALSAGADEQTFGATGHFEGKAQKELRDKYWKSALAGRIGSYLPGMLTGEGEAALGANALKRAAPGALDGLVGLGRGAIKHLPQNLINDAASFIARKAPGLAAKEGEKILPGLARASGRGGISALLAGTANSVARKGVSEAVPGEASEHEKTPNLTDAAWQTGAGMALGPLAHLLMQAAPAIYNHPAFLNPNDLERSEGASKEMLDKGIWGSLRGTFKPYGEQMKQVLEDTKQRLLPKAITNEQNQADLAHEAAQAIPGYPRTAPRPRGTTPVADLQQVGKNKVRDALANSAGEDTATAESFDKATKNLNPDQYGMTTIGDVDRNAKLINTDIKNGFSRTDKGKGFGELDGALSAKKNRLMDLKQAHSDVMDQALDANLEAPELADLEGARESYGKGRNLQDNIQDFERKDAGSGPDWGHAHTKERFGSRLVNKTIGTAPVRTGIGVLLHQFSGEGAGSMAGRIADMRQRGAINQPEVKTLEHFLEKATPDAPDAPEPEQDEENPYLQVIKPQAPAQGAQNSSGNPYLDAIGQ